MPHELDIVELVYDVGGWPAGTRGTVVDVLGTDFFTVEISPTTVTQGMSLLETLLDVPAGALNVLERYPQYA